MSTKNDGPGEIRSPVLFFASRRLRLLLRPRLLLNVPDARPDFFKPSLEPSLQSGKLGSLPGSQPVEVDETYAM